MSRIILSFVLLVAFALPLLGFLLPPSKRRPDGWMYWITLCLALLLILLAGSSMISSPLSAFVVPKLALLGILWAFTLALLANTLWVKRAFRKFPEDMDHQERREAMQKLSRRLWVPLMLLSLFFLVGLVGPGRGPGWGSSLKLPQAAATRTPQQTQTLWHIGRGDLPGWIYAVELNRDFIFAAGGNTEWPRSGFVACYAADSGKEVWRKTGQTPGGLDAIFDLRLDGGLLFARGGSGGSWEWMGCFDTASGEKLWEKRLEGGARFLDIGKDSLRVGGGGPSSSSGGWAACYGKTDGNVLWEKHPQDLPGASACEASDGELILASLESGQMARFDRKDGKRVWMADPVLGDVRCHGYALGGRVQGGLVFATGSGGLGAFDAETGAVVWLKKPEDLPGQCHGFRILDGRLRAGGWAAKGGWLGVYDAKDGKPFWEVQPGNLPGWLGREFVSVPGILIVGGRALQGGWLRGYAGNSGHLLWALESRGCVDDFKVFGQEIAVGGEGLSLVRFPVPGR